MNWLKVLTAVIIINLLVASPAIAADSRNVTITATGYICAPPGLTVTYVSEYEVLVEWTKGTGATNTMIRAAVGRIPEDRDDGYLIYYGSDASASYSDWENNLGMIDVPVYYRAWSEDALGVWEELGASDSVEGIGMVLIALIVMSIVFMATTYIWRRNELAFAAAGGWAVAAFFVFDRSASTNPTEITDIYMGLFWLFISLVITCVLLPMFLRERKDLDASTEEILSEPKRMENEYKQIQAEMSYPMIKRNRKRRSSILR